MRKLLDPDNAELRSILEALLAEGVTVTAREVARRHSCLNDASAFTRNAVRKELIAEYAQRQADTRAVHTSPESAVDEALSEKVRERNERIAELEQTVKNLAAAHVGLIRAVQLAGGFRSLEKFWQDYSEVAGALRSTGGTPEGSAVVQLGASASSKPAK